jgi:hypothetical protein
VTGPTAGDAAPRHEEGDIGPVAEDQSYDLGNLSLPQQRPTEPYNLGFVAVAGTQPESEQYNFKKHRESARVRVAYILMGLLVVLSIAIIAMTMVLVRPFDQEAVGLLISGVLGPIIGIVGAVVGFYFGQEAAENNRP